MKAFVERHPPLETLHTHEASHGTHPMTTQVLRLSEHDFLNLQEGRLYHLQLSSTGGHIERLWPLHLNRIQRLTKESIFFVEKKGR